MSATIKEIIPIFDHDPYRRDFFRSFRTGARRSGRLAVALHEIGPFHRRVASGHRLVVFDDGGDAAEWKGQVARISAGADTAARGQAITSRLDAMGVTWREEAFEQKDKHGRNLLADLGGKADAPLLLIGAHYDRVAVGHGVACIRWQDAAAQW